MLCIVMKSLDHYFLKVYVFSLQAVILNTRLPNMQVPKRD